MARRFLPLFAGLAALLVMAPRPALAWSELARRAVADLAYQRLTPAAQRAVGDIITQALSTPKANEAGCVVHSFPDAAALPVCMQELDLGRYEKATRWRTDPIPLCGVADKTSYCAKGQCASEALRRALATLTDPTADAATRLIALAQVSDLVTNLHQPLNVTDNKDREGARIRVSLPGAPKAKLNLHEVWDDQFVATAVGSEDVGLGYLEPLVAANGDNWARGDIDNWVDETHRLAVAFVYPRLPQPPMCGKTPDGVQALDRAYISAATPVVRQQLAKAAVRLAVVLNERLGR